MLSQDPNNPLTIRFVIINFSTSAQQTMRVVSEIPMFASPFTYVGKALFLSTDVAYFNIKMYNINYKGGVLFN